MARIQTPPSSARRQPERTANEIVSRHGFYRRPVRRYRLGTHPRKQYFVSRADQHLTPANWWGIDPDLIPIRAPIGVQAGVGKPLASQTLGLNVQQQRQERNQIGVLDASPPDPGHAHANARAYLPVEPAEPDGILRNPLSTAALQRAFAKQVLGQGYTRTLTNYIHQSEPEPSVKPADVRQNWRNALDSFARAVVGVGESTPTPGLGDRIKYLLSTNVVRNVTVMESDIEETKYQYWYNFMRRPKLADYINAKLAVLDRAHVAASLQNLESDFALIIVDDNTRILHSTIDQRVHEDSQTLEADGEAGNAENRAGTQTYREQALARMDRIADEAAEEEFELPTDVGIENARAMLAVMFNLAPREYDVYPMPDGEVAIDTGKPERRIFVFCPPNGGVQCIGWIGNERRDVSFGTVEEVPTEFLSEILSNLETVDHT